jgi:AcrR family transcriptional regulator
MKTREERRDAAVELMADHLLSEGLSAATLRPLAAAAGTSDRMLLYYFADKDEILSVTLHRLAERMLAQLDEAVPVGKPRPFRILLEEVGVVVASDGIKPFMHLWLDLASGASRGLQPHLYIAGQIADKFLAWVTSRLKVKAHENLAASAALFLTFLEGMHLLDAIGRPSIAESAATALTANSRRAI